MVVLLDGAWDKLSGQKRNDVSNLMHTKLLLHSLVVYYIVYALAPCSTSLVSLEWFQ